MDRNDRDYLRSLVRMDIRKRERNLAKFVRRPGQSVEEAAEIRAKFVENLEFKRSVLRRLEEGDE